MNDATSETGSVLARALAVLSELAAAAGGASPDRLSTLVAELPRLLAPRTAPPDLIAGPVPPVGLEWHAEQLARLCRQRSPDESVADAARRRYHARMLGYGLAPEREEFRPLVTILIPVFNRAGPLIEAVQCGMDQTWRPIEILVIDDGSTDDPAAALAHFGAAVRVAHKPNGGVASARNLGLRMAQGDFVHLLDSDDLLLPAAIESKIAAFAAVADADLCYGQSQWIDMRTTPPHMKERQFRELHNPIRSMIVEFAFPVPTVMMPRWRMLDMPPFEEDLHRSSDFRYWQTLGFAGIKAIGVRAQTAFLRRFRHSLQATPHPHDDSHAVALLRGLRDLVRHPHAWPYAFEYTNILTGERARYWFATARSGRVQQLLAEVVAALQEGDSMIGGDHLSMLPMLAALRERIGQLRKHGQWPDQDLASVYHVLSAAISRAIEGAPRLSDRDIAFWTRKPEAPIRYQRLHRLFAAIKRHCPEGHATGLADVLLRRSPTIPRRKLAKLAARFRPVMGARFAGMAVARWMQWRTG
ncbi:MAG: glycosyltransferase family 2 protein [Dongiaceae bacterium]